MIEIYTIGVYNSTETEFFSKLKNHEIELFCDIRQRRGVRGAQYKFVNSLYLQSKLKNMGIKYIYVKALAPTSNIREKQKQADIVNKETKKQRKELGIVFKQEYSSQILNSFDFNEFVDELTAMNAKRVVLFCVEENAKACHRSLVAKELSQRYKFNVIDL